MFMQTHTHTHTHIPITNRYEMDGLGFEFFRGKILVVRLNRPNRHLVPQPASYSMGSGVFPRGKVAGEGW